MIKFELKKLFIKQYGLYLIIVLVVLKLFSSAELFKPDSGSVFAALIVIAVAVIIIACAVVISAGKNKLNKSKKLPLAAGITVLTMLLSGCSSESGGGFGSAGRIAQSGENYFVFGDNIAMLDGELNTVKERIMRDVFAKRTYSGGVFADGNYLYYSAEFKDGSRINRINLTDFSEENVYFGDYASFLGQTKYFDMITVWSEGRRDSVEVKDFFVSGGKLVMSMQSNAVYSLDISTKKMTYLFEDVEVNDLCASNGMIYYANLTGELVCFDGREKHTVSDRIFNDVCADESRVYALGTSGVFGYDSEFNETEYSRTGGDYGLSAYNEKIAFQSNSGWVYIDENGEHDISNAERFFVCKNGLIIENDGKYSFNNDF